MRLVPRLAPALALFAASLPAIEVGEGAPSETIRREFNRSYFRNGFHLLAREPASKVKKFGNTGLVQEFVDKLNSEGVDTLPHYALVKANTSDLVVEGVETIFHVYPRMFTYYSSVGANTAGYPVNDTSLCTVGANACLFQLFDKNHALFVYEQATIDGQNFTVRDEIFTRWRTLGLGQLGPPVTAEASITSSSGVTATGQQFAVGAIYSITSGALNGRVLSVRNPIYELYSTQNRHAGFLGLPTAEETLLASGKRRQTFEGGAIEYEIGGSPMLVLPVSSISVSASAPVERLNLGEAFTLTASLFAANGALLDGRAVSWTTSNSRVLALEPGGASVTVRAVGGGSATITAFSEGKSSRSLTYFVTAPCCQVGEGAPTAAVQQSFQDAVTRNRLSVILPAASLVRRVAGGYSQELASADATARYLLVRSDARPTTYVVTGAILARYVELGGPSGALGFPLADATARGRQVFEGGALAGDPVLLVTGAILTRWAAQNYESGPAGLPVSSARAVLSFAATSGAVQEFTGGLIAASLSGPRSNRAFLVAGLIRARYISLNGASGKYGLPTSEEGLAAARRRQEFEGGVIDYAAGDQEATASERERRPVIFATPSAVPAGSRVRLAAGGFEPGATLRVSVSGRPDFAVATESGAHTWEVYVPPDAASGLVTLRAADLNGTGLAVGSYVVQSAAETLVRITKLRGDLQTGPPGARLPIPLRILVQDENNVPLPGLPVRFTPSPGAHVEGADALTDARGEAQAWLRLPMSELPALATAEAGRQVVTFSTRAQAVTLTNFPRLTQNVNGDFAGGGRTIARKGALLAAVASILRYWQNRGDLPSPNGAADTAQLNAFLREYCVFDYSGQRICDGFVAPPGSGERNVNLWRLAAFVGGNLDIVPVQSVRDQIAAGLPVLLSLAVSTGEVLLGSHFVVAIGVTGSGGIVIHDPSTAFGRSSLDEYLSGFSVAGRDYRAAIVTMVALVPTAPSAEGFLVATEADVSLTSPTGECGFAFGWYDVSAGPEAPSSTPRKAGLRYCDGLQPLYQLDFSATGAVRASVTGLADPGSFAVLEAPTPSAWRLHRPDSNWRSDLLEAAVSQVRNTATYKEELSPGVLAAIFGSGLAGAGQPTVVEVGGVPARVLAATAFQVNAELPPVLAPGAHTLTIRSPFGAVNQPLTLQPVSPGIFSLAGGRGAVLNQDGRVNGVSAPASRGQVLVVYCTGLGATTTQGGFIVTELTVVGRIDGRALETRFAGPAPGLPGVYQANLWIPPDLPPGLDLALRLEAGGVASDPVLVAVE